MNGWNVKTHKNHSNVPLKGSSIVLRMLADCFREHLADIRNAKVGKEVASHFNQAGHTIDDVAVSGISYQPMISQTHQRSQTD